MYFVTLVSPEPIEDVAKFLAAGIDNARVYDLEHSGSWFVLLPPSPEHPARGTREYEREKKRRQRANEKARRGQLSPKNVPEMSPQNGGDQTLSPRPTSREADRGQSAVCPSDFVPQLSPQIVPAGDNGDRDNFDIDALIRQVADRARYVDDVQPLTDDTCATGKAAIADIRRQRLA